MCVWQCVETDQKIDCIESRENEFGSSGGWEGGVFGLLVVPSSALKYLYDMLTVSPESKSLCGCVC